MILTSLELSNFRNYTHAYIEFGPHKNFFIGKNAQGKTNLLEAIYLLCLSKSFRTNYEKEAISFAKKIFVIKGIFKLDNENTQNVIFQCSQEQGKQITINRKRLNKISELIGNFPVVLSSPDEYKLTIGPPPGRRKFVDILLSQIYKKYFFYLQDYYRVIQQRNAILLNWKISGTKSLSVIEPWDQRLVEIGSKIIQYRSQFAALFSESLGKIYSELIVGDEKLTFNYKPNVYFEDIENIEKRYAKKLTGIRKKEIQRGTSLLGPHRDDFVFNIDDQELKKYGSRGQHKTVLISLAIAQYDLFNEKIHEIPLLLIDDLYSEIDSERKDKIVENLNRMGQIFITSTSIHDEHRSKDDKYFVIENSKIKDEVINHPSM